MMDFVKAYAVDGRAEALAFAIKHARKDLGYYCDMAEEAGADAIMSRCTRQALDQADATGYGDRMVSEMVDFYAERFVGGRDA
jgi:2-hydroxy-3-oxopropionate reductase